MQNYRPGVAERLGVDYEALRAINPRLVYVSISGYGDTGPYRDRPGQDLLLQAMSGAMLNTGRAADPPLPAGQYLVDAVTAYTAFEGALAALLHRERAGEGQLVKVNMLDAIVTMQMQELSVFTVGGQPQRRTKEPHAHVYIRAPYGIFATKDGFLALAFPPLKKLAAAIDAPALATMDDEVDTFGRRDEIFAVVRERLLTRPLADWLAVFAEHDIWAGPVYGYAELVRDSQIAENKTFVEYDHPTEGRVKTPGFAISFSRTPSTVARGAPLAGQHTREILRELGLDDRRIDELLTAQVVAQSQ
jgi:crotonobetainyl-CoA:carnitine CoA-transferase CaiB-like acyl-CoA transferase